MTDPWYKKGLRFGCTQCGKCCTGSPGYVWVNEKEMEEMATFLKITLPEFIKLYTRKIEGQLALKELGRPYDCIFLRDGKCQVYGARPTQCRTFPFWKENLESKEAWEETALRCEGVNHPDAPLISLTQIQKQLGEMED